MNEIRIEPGMCYRMRYKDQLSKHNSESNLARRKERQRRHAIISIVDVKKEVVVFDRSSIEGDSYERKVSKVGLLSWLLRRCNAEPIGSSNDQH